MSGDVNLKCQCSLIPNVAVIGMGSSLLVAEDELSDRALETLETIAERGGTYWWLNARHCSVCGQDWLVAQEERQNDVYCLRRLDRDEATGVVNGGIWPSDFDSYEALLEMGLRAGHSFRFVDPFEAGALDATIEDLAKARPYIRVSELARLLNLDAEAANRLAARVAERTGVAISFDLGARPLDD